MSFRTRSRRTVAAAALIPAALVSATTAYATESPTGTATPTATASTYPDLCPNGVHWDDDPDLDPVIMPGLPDTVSAGDGWHEYTIRVQNITLTTLKDIDVQLSKEVHDFTPDMPNAYPSYVALQSRDRRSGEWRNVPFSSEEPNIITTHFATTDLAPATSLPIQLRFRVAEDFPVNREHSDAIGSVTVGVRTYRPDPDGEGPCTKASASKGLRVYEPGSGNGDATGSPAPTSGSPASASGSPASASGSPASASGSTTPADDATPAGGALTETGSSSGLALLAGAGGATLAVVGGAVYAVRRRRAGDA
jgi:hypothetical protein